MKSTLLILLFFSPATIMAQEEIASAQSDTLAKIRFKSTIRSILFLPSGVGDNYIAKAHHGKWGAGLRIDFFEAYNFIVGTGGEFIVYDVTDEAIAGKVSTTMINSGYLELSYRIRLHNNITFYPRVSGGYSVFQYNNKLDDRDSSQDGPRIGTGAFIDYKVMNWFELGMGIDYTITYPHVETNAAYKDFFGKVEQLNFSLSAKFNIRN
jgi:hypothetical protein